MAQGRHKRSIDDDFIYTISDGGEVSAEEEFFDPKPPKKKARSSKNKTKPVSAIEDDEPTKPEDDDGDLDPDFEFMTEDVGGLLEFDGWGFEGAKKTLGGVGKNSVDLDDIIRRQEERKSQSRKVGKPQPVPDEEEQHGEAEEDTMIDLDDAGDEVLADDAFGMQSASDEEENEAQEDEEGSQLDEDDDSDNGSIAEPIPDEEESDDDMERQAEEEAKRRIFFGAEPTKKGKKEAKISFQEMSLSRPILRGLDAAGYVKPTPIQAKTIPIALMGKDLVGGAVTGSGKTAAFILPVLERLLFRPRKVAASRVVVLTPTRELAIQCHSVATKLASFIPDVKFTLAVGGLSLSAQEAELKRRPDVIIATPGRFIDHMRNSASFATDAVEILVLDEADRMLEDGFADELNEILTTLPKTRQTMLFSATMTSSVDRLIRVGLKKPVRLMVDAQGETVSTLTQEFVRLRPGREEKRMGYLVWLCKNLYASKVIIFFRQKKAAHHARVVFGKLGMSCAELHGSLNQSQRIAGVEAFRDGKASYLLATDVASRGLDIKGVDTVINYEAPQTLDIYIHRVGRTARAGRSGIAVTIAAEPDRKVVKAAVKAGKAQGAKISSRVIAAAEADEWQARIDDMSDEIEEVLRMEKEEKHLSQAEMLVKKGENIIEHEAEIKSRPKRTWFESAHDKQKAKDAGKAELNGPKAAKNKKKLSNKDKKKLDAKAERAEGHSWKKGKAERSGKGAVLNLKKPKAKGSASKGGGVGKNKGRVGAKGKMKPKRR